MALSSPDLLTDAELQALRAQARAIWSPSEMMATGLSEPEADSLNMAMLVNRERVQATDESSAISQLQQTYAYVMSWVLGLYRRMDPEAFNARGMERPIVVMGALYQVFLAGEGGAEMSPIASAIAQARVGQCMGAPGEDTASS